MVDASCDIRNEYWRRLGAGGQTMGMFDLGGVFWRPGGMVQFFVTFYLSV